MTTDELNAIVAKAEAGDIAAMNQLTHIYGEVDGFINHEQAAKWFLELIKRDCDPNSGVYENTGYNKELYAKIKTAVLNSKTEEEMMSSMSGGGNGGSLLGGVFSVTTSNAKSYINQAEEIIKHHVERAKREREESERQEREKRELEELKERNKAFIEKLQIDYDDYDSDIEEDFMDWWEEYDFELIKIGERRVRNPRTGASITASICAFVIPEGVTHIGNNAFNGQAFYASVVFPRTLKTIGEYAFASTNLEGKLTIPEGVESVGSGAFSETMLDGVRLPKSLKSIGNNVFEGTNLEEIIVPKGTKQRFAQMGGLKGLESKIVEE